MRPLTQEKLAELWERVFRADRLAQVGTPALLLKAELERSRREAEALRRLQTLTSIDETLLTAFSEVVRRWDEGVAVGPHSPVVGKVRSALLLASLALKAKSS